MDEYVKETLGEYLRREREARHISLEDIPLATRISSPFIRALEENDFDFFSQKEAIPGYLKLYAHHLGLDYEDVLRRYTIQSELNSRSKAFQQLPLFLDFSSPIRQAPENKGLLQRHLAWIIAAAVVVVMLGGMSLYLYLLPEKATDREETREPLPSPSLAQKTSVPAEPALPAAPQEQVKAAPQSTQTTALPMETNEVNMHGERAATAPVPAQHPKKKVIGNRDSKRYHLPGMKYYDKVKAYHRVEFNSEREAIKAGYNKARE